MSILDNLDIFDFGGKGKKLDRATEREIQKLASSFDGVNTPEYDTWTPDEYDWLGDVTLGQQGGTEFDNISLDPRMKDAQMQALMSLQDIGNNGGRTLADDANMNKILSSVNADDRGRREAILQNANARGMGGSGMEMLAQLDSSQAATSRANQGGLDVAAQAEMRALDAMQRAGLLGGQIRSQEFDEQAQRARSQDLINNFNTGVGNTQIMHNSQGRQDVANQNVGVRNQVTPYANQLKGQGFQDQVALQNARNSGTQALIGHKQGQADRLNQSRSAVLGGAAKVGAAYAGKP
jgi:hypothetical protein